MSFNSVGQYTANHKVWDHVGNVIPSVDHYEGVTPGHFKVASWLPVQMYDKYYENWWVLLPGKGVSLDNNGDTIPAGFTVSGVTISYTASDVSAGTIDITTGVAVTAAATYTLSDVDGTTYSFMGVSGTALNVSPFVGYAPYPYLQWAGDAGDYDDGCNPAGLKYTNYNMQHGVAICCDYVIAVPIVPQQTATESVTFTAPTSNISTNTGDALTNLPVAKNTMRTTIAFADGGSGHADLFVVEKATAAEVVASGDWHINLTTGIITVYSGTATPTGVTVTYYNYAAAPTGSNVSKFACALGDLNPGDFVKFNIDSNYVAWVDGTDDVELICGQVLQIQQYPMDYLEKVKTAYATAINTSATGSLPGYAGQMDQMPGSATGGVDSRIHYAGGADLIAVINFFSR